MIRNHPVALVVRMLERLEVFVAKAVVLFSGHFAPEQLTMLEDAAAAWKTSSSDMRVLARAVSVPLENTPEPRPCRTLRKHPVLGVLAGPRAPGESAHPGRHTLHQIPTETSPAHTGTTLNIPLWGVIGQDPRTFDPSRTLRLLDAIVSRLVSDVDREGARMSSAG